MIRTDLKSTNLSPELRSQAFGGPVAKALVTETTGAFTGKRIPFLGKPQEKTETHLKCTIFFTNLILSAFQICTYQVLFPTDSFQYWVSGWCISSGRVLPVLGSCWTSGMYYETHATFDLNPTQPFAQKPRSLALRISVVYTLSFTIHALTYDTSVISLSNALVMNETYANV